MQPNIASKFRLGRIFNAAAVCAVALLAAVDLSNYPGFWNPSACGDFGFVTGRGPVGLSTITEVLPGSSADGMGLKLGDTISRPSTLRDRLLATGWMNPQSGERLTMSIVSGRVRRTVQLQAHSIPSFTLADGVGNTAHVLEFLVFLAVGLVLALLRPSRMTWGLYLFALPLIVAGTTNGCAGYFFQMLTPVSFVTFWLLQGPLIVFGIVGFLAFCLRFPSDAPIGWRKSVDAATPYLAIALVPLGALRDLTQIDFKQSVADSLSHVYDAVSLAILSFGTIVILLTYLSARGLDRYKMQWVVFGLAFAVIPVTVTVLSWENALEAPAWFFSLINLLIVPLPLAIGYAVIRHRVIDVRFVVSRALVVGVIAFCVVLTTGVIDWLVSTRLPTSRLDVALIAGAATVMGFLLNAMRRSISNAIDLIFFTDWLRTRERAQAVGEAVRGGTSTSDLHEPLTTGIARAFSLASAALFDRVEDGGFMRVAAAGWPPGSCWHLLLDDPIVARVDSRPRAAHIEAAQWEGKRVPSGVAQPAIMVPIITGKRVLGLLLFGAHENGTSLDPDEIRAIRGLVAEAALLYGRSPTATWGKAAFAAQPLGA